MQITYTFRNDRRFTCIHKNLHQRAGKNPDDGRNDNAESNGYLNGGVNSHSNPILVFCTMIL